jgi:hypothetical protein
MEITVQGLLDWCLANNVSLDTPITLRSKDDFLLVEENIDLDSNPYFGNCENGDAFLNKVAPRDEDGDIDYENLPTFLILRTGY